MTVARGRGGAPRSLARIALATGIVCASLTLPACAGVATDTPTAESPGAESPGTSGTSSTFTSPSTRGPAGPPSTGAPPGSSGPADPTGKQAVVLARIGTLEVAARTAPEPYRRARFGTDWSDDDRDCHDARAEVLMRDSRVPVTFRANGCTVDTGSWVDPWNGAASTLASAFQIDHTVPLANAWVSGAWRWTDQERRRFANDLTDPDTLLPLEGANNTAKSDKTPDVWRPQLRASWCRYADAWSRVKATWRLTVTPAERDALVGLAESCSRE
jgi:hypothetical protein